MKTELLDRLYIKYDIPNLKFGAIHDKLGDAYEEFLTILLEDSDIIASFNRGEDLDTLEFKVFSEIMKKNGIANSPIIDSISATTNVPPRSTGGLPKTDVIATVSFNDGSNKKLTLSSKQSTVNKVAMAEFDVETICREMEIDNPRLKELLLKHQVDCSAKNFTAEERSDLEELMKPIARDFVRWVITGSKDPNPSEVVFPKTMVKYELRKPSNKDDINLAKGDFELESFTIYTMDEYIDTIMLDKYGNVKPGGFGTGLGWTYATGSKGKKMQFKG